jgi:hypothetical protein
MKKWIIGAVVLLGAIFTFNSVEDSYDRTSRLCRHSDGGPAPRGWFKSTTMCSWSKDFMKLPLNRQAEVNTRISMAQSFCEREKGRFDFWGDPALMRCHLRVDSLN